MTGYKVYFDGKEFVMEEIKTTAQSTPSDSVVHWNAGYETAKDAVKNLNKSLKRNIDELDHDKDFVINTCKDCKEYFMVTKQYIDWFKSRDLKVPCRCNKCRSERKNTSTKTMKVNNRRVDRNDLTFFQWLNMYEMITKREFKELPEYKQENYRREFRMFQNGLSQYNRS